jgi:Transposase IS4
MITIDESMIRWYGIGGHWINAGLPNYMAIDRKPENGCEIQNACCGRTGIMMALHLVKGPVEEELELDDEAHESLQGCKIMLHLVRTWSSTRWRIICADSYFASSSAAMQLYLKHFRFIGVVKTATQQHSKAYLSAIEMPNRGTVSALIGSTDGPELLAFVSCDCDRHYFISTCSNIAGGEPIQRVWLRQLEPIETNEEPQHEFITHNCQQAAQLKYSVCSKIDQHNRYRQSGLATEKKIRVWSWDKRVNISIFSMIVVDSFLLHQECTGGKLKQIDYYRALLSALIDNGYENGVVSRRSAEKHRSNASRRTGMEGTSGRGLHITPTKRIYQEVGSDKRKYRQSRCKLCGKKTIYMCNFCVLKPEHGDKGAAFCNPTTGQTCYAIHMRQEH